jgi:hypothetical protein
VVVLVLEENSAPLVADLSENRGIVRVGGERGKLRMARPGAGGGGLHKPSFPLVRRIAVAMLVLRWRPLNVEGDDARNRRAASRRVEKVVIVRHRQMPRLIDGAPAARMHLDAVWVQRHRPEPPIGGNAGVEVVDLLTRLVIHVQSDEAEGAVVAVSIPADVLADHETHIHFPVQTRGLIGYEVVVSALPTHIHETNEAVEVCDGGRVVGGRVGIKTRKWVAGLVSRPGSG